MIIEVSTFKIIKIMEKQLIQVFYIIQDYSSVLEMQMSHEIQDIEITSAHI